MPGVVICNMLEISHRSQLNVNDFDVQSSLPGSKACDFSKMLSSPSHIPDDVRDVFGGVDCVDYFAE